MTQRKAEWQEMNARTFEKIDHTEVYWLGGGGAMINSRGTIVLLDPLLEGFDMPLLNEAPLKISDVGHVDAVCITHSDNDHFSRVTLPQIADRADAIHGPHFIAELLEGMNMKGEGHDIMETFTVNDLKITLTPAWHNWQNDSPKHSKERYFKVQDYCGFYIETPDGSIWMPGDSRLLESQLILKEPDCILMDISDGSWHIGLDGVDRMAEAYPNSELIPIHWGTVQSDWKEFNGDPAVVESRIINPGRLNIAAIGQACRLRKIER